MQIYNTLTRRVEPIVPIEPGRVKIYSCGPTVYRNIHIGNLRTFAMADWLRRALASQGYAVLHVKNITDVGHMRVELLDRGEDKLIAQARREGKTAAQIAEFYTRAFLEDEACLNILPAHVFPRATDHVPEMIAMIERLLAKGLAYASGGNVYFDVTRFPAYGKLSGNQLDALLAGVRDAADPAKRNPEDFALWKAAEPGREMAWESPWGRGFPGWHIECSAMSLRYLGERFDIHTGGVDNIFPHHEDEIAQSEGFTGHPCVNVWVHAQHLLADGLKMAKSTGNDYTRADIEARGFEPLALRYLFATVHYRARLNFTFSALRAAQAGLDRLRAAARHLAEQVDLGSRPSEAALRATATSARFNAAIDNDLNLPQALAITWNMLRGRGEALPGSMRLALLLQFDQVLGFGLREHLEQAPGDRATRAAPAGVSALLTEREEHRRCGRYAAADALREQIARAGYTVNDTPNGPLVWRRRVEEEFGAISRSADVPDASGLPDLYEFSINLIARDNRADLARCVSSIARHAGECRVELVIVDNGSTDDTTTYLRDLMHAGLHTSTGAPLDLRVWFADHNLGHGAGRNVTMRASRGRIIVLLDTSVEVHGAIWAPLERALAEPEVGLAGPYGLVTSDLRDFAESSAPEVDAIEGYLMAFRRALLPETGWANERFRFYRLHDIYFSFMVKAAGYRVVTLPDVARQIERHPHREWHSLTEEERATRSKKNFDIFYKRWHHGQSLLVANAAPGVRWFGHDHQHHLGDHQHPPEELPPPGQPHTHVHQHWPDHAHEHAHYHDA